MLIAVSTVMDSPAHVRRYVEGNLAGGVDHLVVFLDKPSGPEQDEVAAYLDEHPAVTCVRAGSGWWAGSRPRELNERQCTNANVAKTVVAELGYADAFVCHVDGDEVLRADPAALAALPPSTDALHFAVREAVSRAHWDGEPTLFKRELDESDLTLLHGLGLVAEPTNQSYFRGHLMGKSGVRAGADAWLTLHKVVGADGSARPMHDDDGLELFHYESYSAEEFARKWTAMVASGPKASFRPDRQPTARTLRALINRGLDPEALRRQLERFHARFIEEEADALHDLGVLVEADPLEPVGRAGATPGETVPADDLAAAIEERRGQAKADYFHGTRPASGGQERQRGAESSPRGLSRLVRRS